LLTPEHEDVDGRIKSGQGVGGVIPFKRTRL
jgi:hypothetical protein